MSRWKLIDEQPPPEGELVLLATPSKFVGYGIVTTKVDEDTMYRLGGVRTFTSRHGYWVQAPGPFGWTAGLATHWMPALGLPKATRTRKREVNDG